MVSSYKVAKIQDLAEREGIEIELQGKSIAIFKESGELYAIENICPHQGAPLYTGEVREGIIVCPLHAWEFDLKTGSLLETSEVCLKTYAVRLEGEDILIELEN